MTRTDRLPRWPVLLALVAWFPLAPVWRSDDFIAVHYATDLARVLHDFVGNQYGLPGLVWFYRPLITLSFWVDGVIAFRDPLAWCWVSHVSNVLAHAVSTWLLLRILARCVERFVTPGVRSFEDDVVAWGAALWAVAPGHAGSIDWAVGRVDSHTTVWILLCVLAFLLWHDGARKTRALALVAQALALCSKELALVIPAILLVLAFSLARPGERVRHALRAVWPFVVVELLYMCWRRAILGRWLGGYEGAFPPPHELAGGLATWALYGLNPLAWLCGRELLPLCGILGLVPAVYGAAVMARRGRLRVLLASVVLFACCSAPLVQFWAQTGYVQNLRYFYLPLAPLLVILAHARWLAGVTMVLVFLLPARLMTCATLEPEHEMRPSHVTEALEGRSPGRFFVEVPAPSPDPFHVPLYHLGFDRLSMHPFGDGRHRLFALRPLADRPGTGRPGELAPGEAVLRATTYGSQRLFGGFDFERTEAHQDRLFDAALDGPAHWTTSLYWDLLEGRSHAAFVMHSVAAKMFRITLLTAGGWVSAVCKNESSDPSGTEGRVPIMTWLTASTAPGNADAVVVRDLELPTVLDLDLRFPILIEAVEEKRDATGNPTGLETTRTARAFVWVELERDYSKWKPR